MVAEGDGRQWGSHNGVSLRIAEKLGMRKYGTDFHVTGDWTNGFH